MVSSPDLLEEFGYLPRFVRCGSRGERPGRLIKQLLLTLEHLRRVHLYSLANSGTVPSSRRASATFALNAASCLVRFFIAPLLFYRLMQSAYYLNHWS